MPCLFVIKDLCSRLMYCYDVTFRYNAQGLKTIALEYILRNLDNPIVEEGLNVSYYWLVICPFQNSLFLLITSQSAYQNLQLLLLLNLTNNSYRTSNPNRVY